MRSIHINILKDLLKKKIQTLEEIQAYTMQQKEAIAKSLFTQLEQDSSAKQLKINEVIQLDEHFNLVFERLLKEEQKQSIEEISIQKSDKLELKQLVKQVSELSFSIQAVENQNHLRLEQNLAALKKSIKDKCGCQTAVPVITEYKKMQDIMEKR